MPFTDNQIMDMKKRIFNLERQMSKIAKYIIEKEIENDKRRIDWD